MGISSPSYRLKDQYMEATLKIVCDLSNIWHVHILSVLIIIFYELKVHLLSKKIFQEEVHQLCILLLLEIIVAEHHHTSADNQLPPALLVLIYSANRPVAGISQRTRCKYRVARIVNV